MFFKHLTRIALAGITCGIGSATAMSSLPATSSITQNTVATEATITVAPNPPAQPQQDLINVFTTCLLGDNRTTVENFLTLHGNDLGKTPIKQGIALAMKQHPKLDNALTAFAKHPVSKEVYATNAEFQHCTNITLNTNNIKRAKEQSPEYTLNAQQLNKLFEILSNTNKRKNLIPSIVKTAIAGMQKHKMFLGLILIIIFTLTLEYNTKANTYIVKRSEIIPLQEWLPSAIDSALSPEKISAALHQAIENAQWLTLITLLENDIITHKIDIGTVNSIFLEAALVYNKNIVVQTIANSAVLAPKLTRSACVHVLENDYTDIAETVQKSPYVREILKQPATPLTTTPLTQATHLATDDPSQEDDAEVEEITSNPKFMDNGSLGLQEETLPKTHNCADWLAWKTPAPQTTTHAPA